MQKLGALVTFIYLSIALSALEAKEKDVALDCKGRLTINEPFSFDVHVGGSVDGSMYADPPGCYFPWKQVFFNNKFISIENKGNSIVKNPWLTLDNGIDFFSADSIIKSIMPANASDSEKARLVYEFNKKHYFHEYHGTSDNIDPVKLYNAYGYGICGNNATALTALFQRAGLKTRAGHPYGHSTMEVFYDNSFHYLDGDEFIIALKSDNKNVAGEENFVRDPYLLKRTHSYGLKNWGWAKTRDDVTAALFWYRGRRDRNHQPPGKLHTMAFNLRPNEKITWIWRQRLKPLARYNDDGKRDRGNKNFHGEWLYTLLPAYSKKIIKKQSLAIPFKLPYPIAGVSIKTLSDTPIKVSLSRDGKTFKQTDKKILNEGLLNDDFLKTTGSPRHLPPSYQLWVKIESDDILKLVQKPISFKLDFQTAPRALPELRLAQNKFNYRDDSPKRNVEIKVAWQEKDGILRPEKPFAPVFPKKGEIVKGSNIVFKWEPTKASAGDSIVDYQFQLSEYSDFKWTFSSNFDVLLSYTKHRGKCGFATPHYGLFNPGAKYYWRVRARNEKGCWSPWSESWSFSIEAPGMPVVEKVNIDKVNRRIDISWQVNGEKSTSPKYRIYGSKYRGFTPSLNKRQMMFSYKKGKADYRATPPNLIAETNQNHISINFEDSKKMYPFYRVQAVDSNGTGGAYSAQIEIPGPLLLSPPKMTIECGETSIPLKFLNSAGRISNNSGHGIECSITHGDAWTVKAIEVKGADDLKVYGKDESLYISRPLKKGESIKCKINVVGTSYFNQNQTGVFALDLRGGSGGYDKVHKKNALKKTASNGMVLLTENFPEPLHTVKENWKIEPANAPAFIQKVNDKNFLCFKSDKNKVFGWGRISKKLKADGEHAGNIVIEFFLLAKASEINCNFELKLLQSHKNWIFLRIGPWKPVYMTRKTGNKTFRAHSESSVFFEYNTPMQYKWIIKADGSQELYKESKLVFNCKALGGPMKNSLEEFQTAFVFRKSLGFMGIGEIKITYQD